LEITDYVLVTPWIKGVGPPERREENEGRKRVRGMRRREREREGKRR